MRGNGFLNHTKKGFNKKPLRPCTCTSLLQSKKEPHPTLFRRKTKLSSVFFILQSYEVRRYFPLSSRAFLQQGVSRSGTLCLLRNTTYQILLRACIRVEEFRVPFDIFKNWTYEAKKNTKLYPKSSATQKLPKLHLISFAFSWGIWEWEIVFWKWKIPFKKIFGFPFLK